MNDSESAQRGVLVVEDNELVTSAMRILLESDDWRVATANSIAEARAALAREVPTLTLLDLTLPDGNGLVLVPELRDAGCPTVVALTGNDDPAAHQRCIDAGCADVLVKPVPARELISRSATWRNRASL